MAKSKTTPTQEGEGGTQATTRKAAGLKKGAASASAGGSGKAKREGNAESGSGGTPRRGGSKKAAGTQAPDLRKELREFASGRAAGWDHDDWLNFLGFLASRGHDTSNADAIGVALERERLAVYLEQVEGMGPRRVQGVVDRYDSLWNLRAAGVDELSTLPSMNRGLAEKVVRSLS